MLILSPTPRKAHVHDIIMYNDVIKFVREWIDEHPDTMMLSAADHECGGLTLNGYNPLPLKAVEMSIEEVERLWDEYDGDDRRGHRQQDEDCSLHREEPYRLCGILVLARGVVCRFVHRPASQLSSSKE